MSPRPPKVLAEFQLSDRALRLVDELGRINRDNLWEEVQDADAISLEWGILSAQADRRVGDMTTVVEVMRAKLRKEFRAREDSLGKKWTNDSINDEVTLDPRYQQVMKAKLDAEEQADMLTSAKFTTIRRAERLTKLTDFLKKEDAALSAAFLPGTPRRSPMR